MGVEDSLISGGGASTPTPTPEQVPSNADASAAESGTENGNQVNQIIDANPANQANPIKQGFNFAKKSIKKAKTGIYKAKRDIKKIERFLDDPTSLIKDKISNKIDDKFSKFDLEKYNPERVLDPENAAENLKQIKQKAEAKIAEKKKLAQDAAIVAAKAYAGDIPGAIMTVLKSEELKKQLKKEMLKKLLPVFIGILLIGILILGIYGLVSAIMTAIAGAEAESANSGAYGTLGYSTAAWEQLVKFNRLFEDSSLYRNMQTYTNSDGVACYEVKADGGGGSAVGFGVDIATHGAEIRAAANDPSMDLSIGALVPCDIVDALETQELRSCYDYVHNELGVNLTIYQEFALTSRCYNYGTAGGTGQATSYFRYPSNLTFVQAYQRYYNNNRDDHYGDWTQTDLNHNLYTQYMTALWYAESGGQPAGWVTRRQDEWCLFQTGYFGYGLHNGSVGFDEYCILASPAGNGAEFWWPIGSSTTETIDEIEYASGTPVSTYESTYAGHNARDIGGDGSREERFNRYIIASKSGRVVNMATGYGEGYLGFHEGETASYGNYIKIQHDDGMYTVYAHLQDGTLRVNVGDYVNRGQILAKMGTSGNSSGPHLHFEVRDSNNNRLEPLDYIDASNPRPVSESAGMSSYDFSSESYMILDNALNIQSTISNKGYYQSASGYTDACLGFAFSYAGAINSGKTNNIKTSSSVQRGVINNGDITGKFNNRIIRTSKDEIVKLIYDQLNSGKSCVIKVVGSYNNGNPASPKTRHYVAAVGYRKGVDRNSIKDTDLLILDTWSGTIKPVVRENTSGRYLLDGRKASYHYAEAYEIYISN